MALQKYQPLVKYLRKKQRDSIELSFIDIERIIGGLLPKAASFSRWWAEPFAKRNDKGRASPWEEAGFEADLIKRNELVRFSRKKGCAQPYQPLPTSSPEPAKSSQWIPVGASPPSGEVLVWTNGQVVVALFGSGHHDDGRTWQSCMDAQANEILDWPSHWMPLPLPPQ